MKFREGKIARVVNNLSDHGFELGSHVRIVETCDEPMEKCFRAETIDGSEDWWMHGDELEKI